MDALETAESEGEDPESPLIKSISEKLEAMVEENYCLDCLTRVAMKEMNEDEEETYLLVKNYFEQEFAFLAERTRSSVEEHFYGLIEPFLTGILKNYFSKDLSEELWPEVTYKENKIIVVDFSVKEFGIAGIYAQGIVKYLWQQATERRRPKEDGYDNLTFLFVDESQYFVNPNYDTLYQTTARSSLVCTVYLTQSLNNYILTMGSQSPEARAKALMANMGTKIFTGSTDLETNQWASNMIGYHIGVMGSINGRLSTGQSTNISEQLLLQVQPNEFMTLKYGRKENNYKVESYIIKTGPWKYTKANYLKVEFNQR